jgi:hypothetical protein
MAEELKRRHFLQLSIAGTALGLGGFPLAARAGDECGAKIVSPGCRTSKLRVARLFMGKPTGLWPKPKLDLQEEVRSYRASMAGMKELADVEFPVDELVTSVEQVAALRNRLKTVDGILVVHLTIDVWTILGEILRAGRPTVVFAAPYSGHEWASFGALMREPRGAQLDCILSSDRRQLAAALRPFRALHHLREAKILDCTTNLPAAYAAEVKAKFGTVIQQVGLDRVVEAYRAVGEARARAETDRWIGGATRIVEPAAEEIFRASKLALAFEDLLDQEQATVMTVDCYGTMWDKTIKLPAYPCLGFSRLNNRGLAGICESDLHSAMTFIILQALSGRPGFISDPTMDESCGAIILAHCLGSQKMLGLDAPGCPYKFRTVHERLEGVVTQVKMPIGLKVTQAQLAEVGRMLYFTGLAVDSPDVDRGCRTKITVKIDGDPEKLWKNWSAGLHRVTCYGNLAKDLERFCRLANIKLIDEAA